MARELTTTIDTILTEIPDEMDDLIAGLKNIKVSAAFAAPEAAVFWWADASELLQNWIAQDDGTAPVEGWQKSVLMIWTSET